MPVTEASELEKVLNELQLASSQRKTVWGVPIPWVARPVFASGFQIAPDFGAANRVIVATYQVPRGHTAALCGLVFGYAGSSGPALPGQVLYTVDVNNPNAAPAATSPGYTEKDFNAVPFQLGAFVGGPVWPIEFRYDQGEQVRIKAQTVSTVPVGAGNFVFGALVGFEWPSMGWEE